jgi:hypothetical protein
MTTKVDKNLAQKCQNRARKVGFQKILAKIDERVVEGYEALSYRDGGFTKDYFERFRADLESLGFHLDCSPAYYIYWD